MPTKPTRAGKEPVEGSRETIEHELGRQPPKRAGAAQRPAPGDEARPGTPGTGEDLCPRCRGTGKLGHEPCPDCEGSGRITKGIGGA
jgi:hypothetical protein